MMSSGSPGHKWISRARQVRTCGPVGNNKELFVREISWELFHSFVEVSYSGANEKGAEAPKGSDVGLVSYASFRNEIM